MQCSDQTSYNPQVSVLGIPPGNYKATVYYRTDRNVWVWQANGMSPGAANITP